MHIVYVSCSVFILILFVSIGIGLSLTFFECRVDSNDPTAKVNGRANAVFLSYIVVNNKFISIITYIRCLK